MTVRGVPNVGDASRSFIYRFEGWVIARHDNRNGSGYCKGSLRKVGDHE